MSKDFEEEIQYNLSITEVFLPLYVLLNKKYYIP